MVHSAASLERTVLRVSRRLHRPNYCTVSKSDAVIPPELAPIEVVPAEKQLASPAMLGALATVATLALDELQWLFSVMSCVLPSLNVPVAVNCCFAPAVAVGARGVMATDTKVPLPIVSAVVPVTPDEEAEIVTVPVLLPLAIPFERIEARFGFDDFHVIPLRFEATLPSLKVPLAVNLIAVFFEIRGFAGKIVIETS
jgi:hypothetical protein